MEVVMAKVSITGVNNWDIVIVALIIIAGILMTNTNRLTNLYKSAEAT